jgi:hypothetical protein
MATVHAIGERDSSHGLDILLRNGPAQTGVLAGVVAMAGQAAAQLGGRWPVPELAAVAFALLLAVHHVRMVQKLELPNCAVLVPIVTLVLFVTGWGANGLVSETTNHGKRNQGAALVSTLTAENANLNNQLQTQHRELEILRKLAGLTVSDSSSSGPVPGPRSETSANPPRLAHHLFGRLSRLLLSTAFAQTSTTLPAHTSPSPADRERLIREVEAQQEKQRALRREAENLRKEREYVEQQTKKQQQSGGIWKKW